MKKLNDEEVYEIKRLLKEEKTGRFIASLFNVSESTISRIKKNILHKKILVLSEEYTKGFKEGYRKGFKDSKKFETIEQAESPQFFAKKLDLSRKSADN